MKSLKFVELYEQSESNLIDFLRVETGVAITFCDMAELTGSAERRAKLLSDAQKAVNAICYFATRIRNTDSRAELAQTADEIQHWIVELASRAHTAAVP